ncbi:DUF4214 domain-containing protein [Cellulomonas sp. Marseille-Q8402]
MTTPARPAAPARTRRRAAAVALVTALLGAAAGTAPAGAVVADQPDVTHEVDGTVVYVVADPEPQGTDEHFHEGAVVQAFADVDGALVDLSAVQAPVVGTEQPPADGLAQGADVVVTIAADAGLDQEQAVTAAAAEADPRAAVVDVAPAGTADLPVADLVSGVHQLVVLPVRWSTADAVPAAALQTAADGTAGYWERQSAGRIDVQTSVRAAQVVPRPTTCDDNAIMASALAANPGVTPTASVHVAVHFPARTDCGFAGRATIGGGSIWLNGAAQTFVLAHELGHNFGLGHANTLTCVTGGVRVPLAPVAGCTSREYGDNADVMGQGRNATTPGNISSGFAQHLGWATVADLSGPAAGTSTVDLAPLASTSALRGVRLSSVAGPVFADYRPATGPDALHEPGWAGVQAHLLLTDSRYRYPTSYLLDLQPARAAFSSPQLPAGGSWAVPGAGVTLTTVSAAASARVTVAPTGGVTTPTSTPTGTLTQRYVTQVYQDLFGRKPDPVGLATWTTALDSGTPRIAVANAITYSAEYRSRLIAESYQTFLGRGPDPVGGAGWLGAMQSGMIIQQMEAGFLASPEHYAGSGSTDAGWVTRLYQQVLGRSAGASEIASWTSTLARGASRYDVAMGFLLSTEHLTAVVDGHYVHLLDRHIDPTGARSWVRDIQQGARVEAVIGGIIASAEYYSRL